MRIRGSVPHRGARGRGRRYHRAIRGDETPNIDRIGPRGVIHLDEVTAKITTPKN